MRRKESCPACGKFCRVCEERNYFRASQKCKGKKRNIRGLQTEYNDTSELDTEYFLGVSVDRETSEIISALLDSPKIHVEMLIDGKPVNFQLYSGASTNAIPARYVHSEIVPTPIKLKMWNQSILTPL